MGPGVGEALRGGIGLIDDKEPRLLLLIGMRFEIAAYEVAVPLPVVFAVGCGVDADEAAAVMDIVLQCGLFLRAENFAGRTEEDEGCVFAEDFRAEPGRVDSSIDGKTVLGPQLADGGNACADARMMEAVRLTEDKYFRLVEDLQGGPVGGGGEEPGREKDGQ